MPSASPGKPDRGPPLCLGWGMGKAGTGSRSGSKITPWYVIPSYMRIWRWRPGSLFTHMQGDGWGMQKGNEVRTQPRPRLFPLPRTVPTRHSVCGCKSHSKGRRGPRARLQSHLLPSECGHSSKHVSATSQHINSLINATFIHHTKAIPSDESEAGENSITKSRWQCLSRDQPPIKRGAETTSVVEARDWLKAIGETGTDLSTVALLTFGAACFFMVGSFSVRCRTFSSCPGLYALGVPQGDNQKHLQTLSSVPWEPKHPF